MKQSTDTSRQNDTQGSASNTAALPVLSDDFVPSDDALRVRLTDRGGAKVVDAATRRVLATFDNYADALRCVREAERPYVRQDDPRLNLARYAVECFEAEQVVQSAPPEPASADDDDAPELVPLSSVDAADNGNGGAGKVTVCRTLDPERGELFTLEPAGVEVTRLQLADLVHALTMAGLNTPSDDAVDGSVGTPAESLWHPSWCAQEHDCYALADPIDPGAHTAHHKRTYRSSDGTDLFSVDAVGKDAPEIAVTWHALKVQDIPALVHALTKAHRDLTETTLDGSLSDV